MISDASTSNRKVTKIVVVDDHPAIRDALVVRISEHLDLVASREASSVAAAMEAVKEARPDVVIVDITLKDGNGIELIKWIKAYDATIRILVCSMHEEALYAERSIRAGALGYITKDKATTQIVEAIRCIIDGNLYVSERLAATLRHHPHAHGDWAFDRSPVHRLSDREFEVFELIGQAIATARIAERLHLSPKTVETYRARMKEKLGLQTVAELIRRAVQWNLGRM